VGPRFSGSCGQCQVSKRNVRPFHPCVYFRCSSCFIYNSKPTVRHASPFAWFCFLQMGRLHVPRLQGAPVYLRERRFQALERLGGPFTSDPVCPTCARHAVAQEGLFPWPGSGSGSWPQPGPWACASTSCTSCYSWSQLSSILTAYHGLPPHCRQCLPSNLTLPWQTMRVPIEEYVCFSGE